MPALDSASVGLILVSHDGSRWLPTVLDGLAAQTVPVQHTVVVDTGSRDDSVALCEGAYDDVVDLPVSASYPEAVVAGLDRLGAASPGESPPEWIWLLHDDSTPAPHALETLLATAAARPEADVLGPKLREWPSLRRLLELGVTISGTGRRETGLERGEYDQGQHDEVREVLAVNTAGMLVRREVLEELGGFDPHLPVFGNDLDFGWRAAAAGHTTLVVPGAVVFHAEAAHRGLRRTALTGRHTHFQERRAALYTLLVNSRGRYLPFLVVRLFFGTLLRMLGFLVVRSVGEALDDLAALGWLAARPGLVREARRRRREQIRPPAEETDRVDVRRLLARPWVPYRHGLDFLSDLAAAATNQASDVAERRRAAAAALDPSSAAAARITREQAARRAADHADPDDPDDVAGFEDAGLATRFLTNPTAVVLTMVVLLLLVLTRSAVGAVSGGGLSPVPDAAGDWWRLYLDHRHAVGQGGQGSLVPAPGYLLPLAALGALLGPVATVSSVLLLAAPVALWGAWRFLRVAGRLVRPRGAPRPLLVWGSVTYAVTPLVSGAWSQGRLGPVVAAALLPWVAHATLGFADPAPERRWRAAWRTGLLLTLLIAFAPTAWLLAVLVGVVVLGAGLVLVGPAVRARPVWGPPAVALLVPPALWSPWWLPVLLGGERTGGVTGLLVEIGRPPGPELGAADLLLGRWAGLGAPPVWGIVLLVLAVCALVPRTTRVPVLLCWGLVLLSSLLAVVLSRVEIDLTTGPAPASLGVLAMVIPGALVVAVTLGGLGLAMGAKRELVVAAAVAAVVVPMGGLAWFAVSAPDRLAEGERSEIPAYMVQEARTSPERGVLVLRGSVETGVSYVVRRGDGVSLGEDEIITRTPEDAQFTRAVEALTSRPTPGVVGDLAARGVAYIVLLGPQGGATQGPAERADGSIASGLDATGGLVAASAEDRRTRAWQVSRDVEDQDVVPQRAWWRTLLVIGQLLAGLVVALLCLPALDRRGR